jgi:hypothetical protein
MPQTAEVQRARYHKKRALGECSDCSNPAMIGMAQCENHRKRRIATQMDIITARKDKKLCIVCGSSNIVTANHCQPCRERVNGYNQFRRSKIVKLIRLQYGESCTCCGESEPVFLTIDHVNDDGSEHRQEVGFDIYRFLYAEFRRTGKWPEGFTTLCYNCNAGRWRNGGECPHQRKKRCMKMA